MTKTKKPISKAVLRLKIKACYKDKTFTGTKVKYGRMNAKELFWLSVRLGLVDEHKYRIHNRSTTHLKKFTKGPKKTVTHKGKKYKAKRGKFMGIGIQDQATKASPKRTTTDIKKWKKNIRYWDFKGKDDGMSPTNLRGLAGVYGVRKPDNLSRKALISRIAKLQRD